MREIKYRIIEGDKIIVLSLLVEPYSVDDFKVVYDKMKKFIEGLEEIK